MRNVEKGNYMHCFKSEEERYSEQVVTSEEKGWTYYKSEGNKYVLQQHFKMDGQRYLRFKLCQVDFMSKIGLNDAYFSVRLEKVSRKLIRFQ